MNIYFVKVLYCLYKSLLHALTNTGVILFKFLIVFL